MARAKREKMKKGALKKAFRLYRFIRPYRFSFFVGFVFLLLTGATAIAFPKFMGMMVDAVKGESGFTVNQVGLILALVIVLQSVFSFFRIYLFVSVAERGLAALRIEVFQHLIRLPKSYFDTQRVGELNSRISNDISLIQDTFTTSLAELIRQLIIIVGGIIALFTVSVRLTLFMLAIVPLVAVFAVIFGKALQRFSKLTQKKLAESNTILEESMHGITTVKAFTAELFQVNRYKAIMQDVVKYGLKGALYRGFFATFIIFCIFGAIIAVVWYAAILVQDGLITLGELFTFVMYTVFIGASIGGIAAIYAQIVKAVGATEEVLDVFEQTPEKIQVESGVESIKLMGNIQAQDVQFSYPSRKDVQVLKGIDFEIKQGQKLAIVGSSGSGKSTLASLVMGFYDFDGLIQIDGTSIQEIGLTPLRKNISIVPQETLLFGGSVRENILYGNPKASKEELIEATKTANAYDFIMDLPEGFDTLVGDRGMQLSGGQRQRIAIARAVIKDPSILILDEATSSLDSESEKEVQIALDQVMQGRTSLIIAHRFSTIKSVDKILVLEQGKVKEFGTHDQLIQNKTGVYSKLLKLQQLS